MKSVTSFFLTIFALLAGLFLYRCYYRLRLRDALSIVFGIFKTENRKVRFLFGILSPARKQNKMPKFLFRVPKITKIAEHICHTIPIKILHTGDIKSLDRCGQQQQYPKHTHRHRNYQIESAQWADSMKMYGLHQRLVFIIKKSGQNNNFIFQGVLFSVQVKHADSGYNYLF